MKKVNVIAGRAILALSITAACSLPLHAQNTAAGDTAATSTTTTQTMPVEEDRDFGWIGLLGLAGLLGLRRKKEEHVVRTTNTTTPRYLPWECIHDLIGCRARTRYSIISHRKRNAGLGQYRWRSPAF